MGLDRALEVHRVDADDPVQLVAPLDRAGGDVPHPPARVRVGLRLAQPPLHLGEVRLRELLFRDVAGDEAHAVDAAVAAEDRADRQAHRDRHPVLALHLDVDVIDAVAGTDRADDRLEPVAQVWGKSTMTRLPRTSLAS